MFSLDKEKFSTIKAKPAKAGDAKLQGLTTIIRPWQPVAESKTHCIADLRN